MLPYPPFEDDDDDFLVPDKFYYPCSLCKCKCRPDQLWVKEGLSDNGFCMDCADFLRRAGF